MSDRPHLMIPGPVDLPDSVRAASGAPARSHLSPTFVDSFGDALRRTRVLFGAPSGQPFILAGSGTLAMEAAAANLIETGDAVLVISTGVFGDRFAAIAERLGAEAHVLRAEAGETVSFDAVAAALERHAVKVVTVTHVDTSTGVRCDPAPIAALARDHGALTILDGVCSVGGEPLAQESWGIDLALTASQKALAAPAGLALLVASPEALDAWSRRRTPVRSYYVDWGNWLPIMEGYEAGTPGYFGTPAVGLVAALAESLSLAVEEGLDRRMERHRLLGAACRAALHALDVSIVPVREEIAASTLTCAFLPEGIELGALLPAVRAAGAVIAGGLHPKIRTRSFRIGHMGAVDRGILADTVAAVEEGLAACGHPVRRGTARRALAEVFDEAA
ncbi:MAG: alanine--glyoxylate aminotransferase family protein [Candidatus Bipolaricaulota bacterium]|nr:MAG: alanine--glyoxylate aminotransferase family protein [Candidatus Bipolaricaulota bacterium]